MKTSLLIEYDFLETKIGMENWSSGVQSSTSCWKLCFIKLIGFGLVLHRPGVLSCSALWVCSTYPGGCECSSSMQQLLPKADFLSAWSSPVLCSWGAELLKESGARLVSPSSTLMLFRSYWFRKYERQT